MKFSVLFALALLLFAGGCSSNTGIVGDWVNNDIFSDGKITAKQSTVMKFRPNGTMRQITNIQAGKVETKVTMTGRYTLTDSNIQITATTMVLEGNYTERKDLMLGLPPSSNQILVPYSLRFGTLTTETKGKKMAFHRTK